VGVLAVRTVFPFSIFWHISCLGFLVSDRVMYNEPNGRPLAAWALQLNLFTMKWYQKYQNVTGVVDL